MPLAKGPPKRTDIGGGFMLARFVGEGTAVSQLKAGLTASSRAVRGIAHRVANAGNATFGSALEEADAAASGTEPIDLEVEMVKLADETLRFEIVGALLEKAYQQIRSSIRER